MEEHKVIKLITGKENLPYFDAQEITKIVKELFQHRINNENIFMHINYMDTHSPANLSNNYIQKNISKNELHNNKLGIEEISAIERL